MNALLSYVYRHLPLSLACTQLPMWHDARVQAGRLSPAWEHPRTSHCPIPSLSLGFPKKRGENPISEGHTKRELLESHMSPPTLLKVFALSDVRCSWWLSASCSAWLDIEVGSKVLASHLLQRSDAPHSPIVPAQPILKHSTFIHPIHWCLPGKALQAARQPLAKEG